jgi:Sigma-70, region 4
MVRAKTTDVVRRNADIVRRYVEDDETLQEIGDLHGLTRERVRQILEQAGVDVATLYRARMARATERRQAEERRNAPPPKTCPVCLGSHRRGAKTCSPECAEVWEQVRFALDEPTRIRHRRHNYESKMRRGKLSPGQEAHARAVLAGEVDPKNRGSLMQGWMAKAMELRARRAAEAKE